MANLTRVWFLLSLTSLIVLIAGFWLGERQGLLIAFAVVLVINTCAYFLADFRLKQMFSGRPMQGQDPWGLNKVLEEMSAQMRIPKPELMIIPLGVPTAFSSGRHWGTSTIFLSESLLTLLDAPELKAVLAHEVSKIKRLDTFAQSVSSSLSGGILWGARKLDQSVFAGHTRFEKIFEPMGLLPVHVTVGRKSYFQADQLASHLIGSPHPLAQALWKLHSYAGTRPMQIPRSTAHLFIVDPLTSSQYRKYFQKHPPVKDRIEKLVGYFPV